MNNIFQTAKAIGCLLRYLDEEVIGWPRPKRPVGFTGGWK